MDIVHFVGTLAWSEIFALSTLQTAVSFVIALIFFSGWLMSYVDKTLSLAGLFTSVAQVALFGALLLGCYWAADHLLDLHWWDVTTFVAAAAFIVTVAIRLWQIPGKLLLSYLCAWEPGFSELQMMAQREERIALAWRQWAARRTKP